MSVPAAGRRGRAGPGRQPDRARARLVAGHGDRLRLVHLRRRRVLLDPGRGRERPQPRLHALHLGRGEQHPGAARAAVDPGRPAVRGRDADRVRRWRADRHVLDRLHARRPQAAALLRLHEPVPVLDAAAGDGRQLRAAAGRLGSGRPLVLPADRVLARAGGAGRRRQEGLRDERDRRRGHRHRDLPDGARHRHHRLPRGVHTRARCVAEGQLRRQLGGAAAAGWALSPNRPRSRSTHGFRTPWRAPPRSVP